MEKLHAVKNEKEISKKEYLEFIKLADHEISKIEKEKLKIYDKKMGSVTSLNKLTDDINKISDYKRIAKIRLEEYQFKRMQPFKRFYTKHLMPSDIQLKKAKSQLYKMFTVGIFGELLKQGFVDPTKKYFTSIWMLRTIASAFGFIIFDLFTVRTANRINRSITRKLIKNNPTQRWAQGVVTNAIKFLTHSGVMALFILITTNKWKGIKGILTGASIGTIGSILYDYFLGNALKITDENEKSIVQSTKYYGKVRNFNRIVASTVKVGISLLGGDIAADGDLDQAGLIKFLVTMFALPFYMYMIEPHILSDCGML